MSATHPNRWLVMATLLGLLGATAGRAEKLHLIVACDTSAEADLGDDVIADKLAIERTFREHIPPAQLNLRTILGDQLSPETVRQNIDSLHVERQKDAIVFYYTGHGAFDSARGQFFALPKRQQILRSEIEAALIAKEPRVAVSITDCCAAGARFRGKDFTTEPEVKVPATISPLFHHLLFARCGLISITSSKPGEVSLTRGDGNGSLFTYPLTQYLQRNASRTLGWETLVEEVAGTVKEDFTAITKGKGIDTNRDGRPDQWTQTVHPFVLTPALGMWVEKQGAELLVTGVIPLSPAYHAGIEKNDAVLEINGSPLGSEQEYSDAVDRSPQIMSLKLRDHRQQRVVDVQATLNK